MVNAGRLDAVAAFEDIALDRKQLSVLFIEILSAVNILGTGAIVTPDTFG